MIKWFLRLWLNLFCPCFGGSSGPPPVAVPVAPPASLFPGTTNVLQQQGPGAIGTATTALTDIASGLDVNKIYASVTEASKRQEAEGRANIMSSMGSSGMAASSDAMRSTADFENQFQANLLQQLQTMQFQAEGLKLGGSEQLMNTYANAGMAFAPTQEVMGTQAGASIFSQAASATTGGAMAAAMLIAALCWVAASFYGWDDHRTDVIRAWTAIESPEWYYNLYSEHGEWISKTPLRWLFRPLFWWILRRKVYASA